MSLRRRLVLPLSLLGLVLITGTGGYMLIEGWGLLDALYQTVITLSSVGFQEVRPISSQGRIFTILLIMGGVGGAAYTLTTIVTLVVEGELGEYYGRRRMTGQIQSMRGHQIICGFGRVGRAIAEEFAERRTPFVVIDNNITVHEQLRALGYHYLDGNATSDDTLVAAGINHAGGLHAAADSDTDNTFIVLTARALNPSIFIVARAGHASSEAKLRRAGADRVISPYAIAGSHMAVAALQPAMVDFMTTTFPSREGELILAELTITPQSLLLGRTVSDVFGRRRATTVLCLRREGSDPEPSPSPDADLRPLDQLIVMGPPEELEQLHASAAVTGAAVSLDGRTSSEPARRGWRPVVFRPPRRDSSVRP